MDLKTPLREHLEDGFDEADLHRTWRGVQRELARREVGGNRHALWAIAFGSAMAALAFVLWLAHAAWLSPGPLRLAEGPLPSDLGGLSEMAPTELSDGSKVTLAPNSHLEVLQNSGDAFVTALRRGRSRFDVKPGGPRRWVIECGLATVEVVGTSFSIQREAGRVGVTVERGVVVVRGERVAGHERRLTAGEQLEVVSSETAQAPPSEEHRVESLPQPLHFSADERVAAPVDVARGDVPRGDVPRGDVAPEAVHVPVPSSAAPMAMAPAPALSASAPAAMESVQRVEEALSPPSAPSATMPAPSAPSATTPASVPEADPVDALLREADRAQRAGDRGRTVEILRRVIQDAHGDPRASFAAFTLARITMDENPRASAASLSAMLDAGVPRGLEEDARARLVEAYARAGDRAQAMSAAADYERRFPHGSRIAEVRRWAHP